MAALLRHITGLLCGTLLLYTSVRPFRNTLIHTLRGNSMGRSCKFPFQYNNIWYYECTTAGRSDGMSWCATSKYYDEVHEWGYCPSSGDGCDVFWEVNNATHICYQFNLQSALSWETARGSCGYQGGDLLSITNPAEHKYISEKLKNADTMLWIGLDELDGLSGWQWTDGAALAFVNWKRNFTPMYYESRHCGTYDAGGEHKWHISDCETRLPYICKKYLKPRQPKTYENWKDQPTQCESNRIHHPCNKLQKEELSWSEASAACRSDGGELMSVSSLADTEFLMHLLNREKVSEAWIGLNSSHRDSVEFQWSDGSEGTFTTWQRHEPNINLEGSDFCVSTQRADGNWKVRPCSRKLYSVCNFKKSGVPETANVTDVTEEKCEENWVRYGDYCYGINLQYRNFLKAVNDSSCPLATITNRFEQAFINSLITSKIIPVDYFYWIALQDIDRNNEYMWLVNGTEHRVGSFTNWERQRPNDYGSCVVLSSGLSKGQWIVRTCDHFVAKSLCKKPLRADVERESNPKEANMDQACAPSWETESRLRHCYRVFHDEKLMRKRTWQEAEDMCQDFGAHLVSLSNLEERRFIERLLRSMFNGLRTRTFWTGYHKRNPSKDSWEWSDGSPAVSTMNLKILSSDVGGNCVAYRVMNWLSPINCNSRSEWICKIAKGVVPKTPDWHIKDVPWVFHNRHNYCFHDLNADFASADFVCGWMQSKVTSILSRYEQKFIHSRIKQMSKEKQKWWIGLEIKSEELQRWGDGSSVIYTNWDTNISSNINSSIAAGENLCAYIESDTGQWGFSDCLAENPAICKTNVTFKIEKHYTPVDNDHDQEYGTCPEDWLYYRNKCFYIYKYGNIMDWYAALYFCKAHGGSLVTITNEIEQAFIVLQLYGEKKGFWIGLTKHDYDLWENGTAEAYTNWSPMWNTHTFLNPYDQDNLCALISANQNDHPTGKWYLEKCNSKGYGVICEKQQDVLDPAIHGSDMFPVAETIEYGDKEYRIISGNMSWHDASIVCQKNGSTLVSITDPYHQAFLTILAHHLGYSLWIGYYSDENTDAFKWIDGSMSLFTSWSEEEPLADGNCVYIDTSGLWRAEDCATKLHGAVCLPSTGSGYNVYIGTCPEEWIRFKHYCYSIHTVLYNKPFHEAEEVCKEQGGEILTLSGDEEAAFIRYEVKSSTSVQSIWLNRLIPGDDGTMAWSGGSKVRYSKWNEESVDADTLTGDYCLSMWMDDGTWRIAQCYERRGFVCKKLEDNTVTCFWNYSVERHHFIISIAAVTTLVIAVLSWYLLKRKRCLSSPNIQRPECTQYSAQTDEVELCNSMADDT